MAVAAAHRLEGEIIFILVTRRSMISLGRSNSSTMHRGMAPPHGCERDEIELYVSAAAGRGGRGILAEGGHSRDSTRLGAPRTRGATPSPDPWWAPPGSLRQYQSRY